MNAKTTIRKILFVTIWLCIGGGMFTLLLAAISKKNKGRCINYSIKLKGDANNLFIDKKDVEELIIKKTGAPIKGQLISSFNLQQLEQELEQNTWIRDAECYFDNKDVLHISVIEKEPVARIFTISGQSFYIDSTGRKMPLSDKLSAKVPVFTGFPDKEVLTARDSILLDEVRTTANFIMHDPFWMAQVSQVDITPARTFEMIPMIGNHTVILGNGENINKKFRRLFVFYQQVLSRTGFGKYKLIDVQYAGQVVVSKQAGNAKIDSIQLRRNVEKLLRQSRENQVDTIVRVMPLPGNPVILDIDPATEPLPDTRVTTISSENPNPVKANPVSTPAEKKAEKPESEKPVKPKEEQKKREPKAVMPPRQVADENKNNNEQ